MLRRIEQHSSRTKKKLDRGNIRGELAAFEDLISTPLDQIDFDVFNAMAGDIDE